NEMDDWFLGRIDTYVNVIEASLAKAFLADPDEQGNQSSMFDDETEAELDFHDGHVPPHFYRELTRTREGCKLLRDKGHFNEFVATIREHGMQYEDAELITKVKGCLWAVGNVGSMELGAPFLEQTNIVKDVVQIAESHEVMSLRGTAFFVLGLIARSSHGLEMLSEFGWDANTSPMGNSLGYCIPNNLSKLFSLEPWDHIAAASVTVPVSQRTCREPPPIREAPPIVEGDELEPTPVKDPQTDEEMNARILELIMDLTTIILYGKSLAELRKLKQRKPSAFRSTDFFKQVMGVMEWNHFRLGVRRVVIDLFEKNVMRQIVFDEENDTSSGEEEEDGDEDEEDEVSDEEVVHRKHDPRKKPPPRIVVKSNSQRKPPPPRKPKDDDDDSGDSSSGESSSGDDRTERQRSVSEPKPAEYARKSLVPPPLNLR
ncbi:hypothetical protein Golomagni_06325, partial [Golovinomyces magnicellulatus]